MTQYERIAQFEVVLKLRDQRRQRLIVAAATTAFVIITAIAAWCLAA